MMPFEYSAHPYRVIFGAGTLPRVADEVARLGGRRVLLLAGPRVRAAADTVRELLGSRVAAEFDGAVPHTPVPVTERALEIARANEIDLIVSVGGGSTTGLGKALALRTNLPQLVVPTTYAGSEVTPSVGQTENGVKTNTRDPVVLPRTVVYDVDLTLGLPVPFSVTSGINALAHAVEALYSQQANPVTDGMAIQAIEAIGAGLPAVAAAPEDTGARAELLRGAWLAGMCLGAVSMGLHHKLCHLLGGAFDLPHAETHTVLLPQVMAYQAAAVPEVMTRIAHALRAPDAPSGVFDLIARLNGPTSLAQLGFKESDVDSMAEAAVAKPYPNPAPLTRDGIAGVLRAAHAGARPAGPREVPDFGWLTEQVVASFARTPDPRAKALVTDLVRSLHEYATRNDVTETEWRYAIDVLTRTGQICSDTRQEFVLLSDVLGVSSMVDLLTNSRTPGTTPSAVLGPFYVEGPPETEQGADISGGLPGTPLWTDVRVTGTDGKPVPDAIVDVWQSNEDGFYDVQLPDLDGPVLRARFRTDADGRLTFWSILPSEYPIPDDGPVGRLLAAVGRHQYRAPHLHFLIAAPGHHTLVTQLFVAGGAYLDSDTVFGVKEELIVEYRPQHGPTPDGRTIDGEWRLLEFTFRIAGGQS
jgi:alcohol dehydrogenase class IV/protocatechuate 3,4-dioxygenase beta subunit